VHNKWNALESAQNHLLPLAHGKIVFPPKPVHGNKRLRTAAINADDKGLKLLEPLLY